MTTAVYPGSFDPLTRGHVSIIRSGLVVFERIIVAVLRNPRKDPLFSVEERVQMIREEFGDTDRVEVEEAREAGPVHVGHQMWKRLDLDGILSRAGLSERACTLSEV
ncbi:MAG: adenylyltransferase/cytidyltransferase family protein, partial [Deltaproteobacteria bacterium]|nr:adenylyltransferase/cytidyltransferase family protein [Deltaproteobacteria bacterium]